MQIQIVENKRGIGYWKLNISLLNEEKYISEIKEIIKNTIIQYKEKIGKGRTWELIKIKVKEFSVSYCQSRSKRTETNDLKLEAKLKWIDENILKTDKTESLIEERREIKLKLDKIHYKKAGGAQVRSRKKWVEEGERSTAYFLSI